MTRSTRTRFTLADQRMFAALSGDRNPVHLDPVVARRTAAGEPIVHGMHLLLRMLDRRLRHTPTSDLRIDATFLQPAFVDEPIAIDIGARGELVAEAAGSVRVVSATVQRADRAPADAAAAANATPRSRAVASRPRVRSLSDIDGAAGVLATKVSPAAARAFPAAVRALGADVVAALASLSALVGMECPGRDSLLSAVHLRVRPRSRTRQVAWRVGRVDRRFGFVRIDVAGDGLAGTVDAFVRPAIVAPPAFAAIADRVRAGEFEGQRALVVGGSRGIGAVTAMLIAAGGGRAVATYASGAADANAVRRAVMGPGRRLETLRLDVTTDAAAAIVSRAVRRFDITHLYYFATPRIFARRADGPFDSALFDRFAGLYVHAFARVCAAAARDGRELDVFYPSSDAVVETPAALTEYAAAKAAGESACAAIDRATAGVHVLVSRLPRVATDQTASVVPAAAAPPIDVALGIVRDMQRRQSERSNAERTR